MSQPRLRDRLAERVRGRSQRDPYAGLPVDAELGEPILPRWFVLALLAMVPIAAAVGAVALDGVGDQQTPVAERRPPPQGDLTTATGEMVSGDAEPQGAAAACPEVAGIAVAGAEADRGALEAALTAACEGPSDVLASLGQAEAVLRFATFEATGVDVTTDLGEDPPVVLVNARFSQQDPTLIAPLLAHEAELLAADADGEDVGDAEVALRARAAQAETCAAVLPEPSRACEEATELLAAPDAVERLQAAGFR